MKHLYLSAVLFLFALSMVKGQSPTKISKKEVKYKIDQNTIVKDSSGQVYPYVIWSQILMSGKGDMNPVTPQSETSEFILKLYTPEERADALSKSPKPDESPVFKSGTPFSHFKDKAIDGEKIDTKLLLGKVIVLNFWFIGCPPCRMEIPDLYQITQQYKDNPDVVFVAIALDDAYELRNYIKKQPLGYHVIDRGSFYASKYMVRAFPTNVVIGKDGKVLYSCQGGSPFNTYWLEKSIQGALNSPVNKIAAQ